MKISHVVAVVALLVASGAGVALYFGWQEWRADRANLQAALATQQHAVSAAQQREDTRQQLLTQTLSAIAQLKKTTQTAPQILRELPQYLPLPQPLQPLPDNSASNANQTTAEGRGIDAPGNSLCAISNADAIPASGPLGNAQGGGVLLPSEDLKPLFDYVQDCRACDARTASAQQDLSDERTKEQAITRERDTAVAAARGGGFWARLKRGAKWFGLGALTGAAAAAIAVH
jgi:hypothetical protein